MRNGQKRMRGRGNHRKSQNPLTRVYESNGPDVKIRGTASHIAEKYIQLARDAQGSGDPVAAEGGEIADGLDEIRLPLPVGADEGGDARV